jgi:hypothetical protein
VPTVVSITDDPSGPVYHQLLELALEQCAYLSLVWRESFKFEPSAEELRKNLAPFKVEQTRTSRWPGTELIGYKALVMTCNLTRQSAELLRISGSLLGWLAPKLPEDLAFYTSDKSCWLATTSREHQAYFVDPNLKVELVQDIVPGIKVKTEEVGPLRYRLLKPDRQHRPPLPG